MSKIIIAMAQFNPTVGDIDGNTERIVSIIRSEQDAGTQIVIFPELSLIGYPPEDLLLRPSIKKRVERAIEQILQANFEALVVLGYPRTLDGKMYNMAGIIHKGQLVYEYAKQCLPNYRVFDEYRYFTPGNQSGVYSFKGVNLGVSVCEDIWEGNPLTQIKKAGADIMLNLNGSPFHQNVQKVREELVTRRAQELQIPIVYVNQVGGQDELVFDGGSLAVSREGAMVCRCPSFEECVKRVDFDINIKDLQGRQVLEARQEKLATIYNALVLGVRDYVRKNGFKGVVLGLSGGIDSALTLAIAADALGQDQVEAVMMPFRYTSQMSLDDAEAEAKNLGVRYRVIGIEPMYKAFEEALATSFAGRAKDTTEENIQARIRGVMLMSLSNKFGSLVLTTGNKSEMAVGYATLYGDMAGGLDVLKDVPKTLVFQLARYRNRDSAVIPQRVIDRPPSAELAPDQKDEDSLPPYEILDEILELYVEQDVSAQKISARGYDLAVVERVLRLVDINEYKRRQAPIGIRITERAFGRDRRYPITNRWHIGD